MTAETTKKAVARAFRSDLGGAVLRRHEALIDRQDLSPAEASERQLLAMIVESVGELGDYDGPPEGSPHPLANRDPQAGEAVAWQIQGDDGRWHNFHPENDAQKKAALSPDNPWRMRALGVIASPQDDGQTAPDSPWAAWRKGQQRLANTKEGEG